MPAPALAAIAVKWKEDLKKEKKVTGKKEKNGRVNSSAGAGAKVGDAALDLFLENLRHEQNDEEIVVFLTREFQERSRVDGGQPVPYLHKVILAMCDLFKPSSTSRTGVRSVLLVYRCLFELAQELWTLPSNVAEDLITLGMDAVKDFPTASLVKVVREIGLKEMRKGDTYSALTQRWGEMFVRFVTVLISRQDITLDTDVVNGKRFREFIVEEICRMDWTNPITKSYLSIIMEIPDKDPMDTDTVLETFETHLKDMSPTLIRFCVPTIVAIAGKHRPCRLLAIFEAFFQQRKRRNSLPGPGRVKRQIAKQNRISLGLVACSFVDAVRNNDSLLKEFQRRAKASTFDHSLVMSPFILTTTLALANIDHVRSSIVDSLKQAILKSFHELNLRNKSCWFWETIGNISDDILESFKYALEEGSSAMDYMAEGVKELGIGLLNATNLQWKYPNTFKKCEELGTYLVTFVTCSNKDQLGLFLKDLLRSDSSVHIECLANCLKQCTRIVGQRDFHARATEILHHLPAMSVQFASAIVKALLPALQLSPPLMDELMIILRKTFWRSTEAGKVCVEVLCIVLSTAYIEENSKMSNDGPNPVDDLIFSQYIDTPSTCGNSRVDQSGLCKELLHLSKRFLLLDRSVREQLYLGLHKVAKRNPAMNDIILGQICSHISEYLSDVQSADDCLVLFKEIFDFPTSSEKAVTIKDELGFLVQCMCFVYNQTYCAMENRETASTEPVAMTNSKEVITKLITFATQLELHQLELVSDSIIEANGTYGAELVPFVTRTIGIQTMQIIEALLEFLAFHPKWSQAKEKVLRLLRKYKEVQSFSEAYDEKRKKKDKESKPKRKRQKNKNTTTASRTSPSHDAETASVVSRQNSVGSSASRTSTLAKAEMDKLASLKPPSMFHIISLDSVCRMLRKIYGTDSDVKSLSKIRDIPEFEALMLSTIIIKVTKLKAKEPIRERPRALGDVLNSLSLIVEVIWERVCISKESSPSTQDSIANEEVEVVNLRLEVVSAILALFFRDGHFRRVLHFRKFSEADTQNELEFCSQMFEEWKGILNMIATQYDGDKGKGSPLLFNILDYVCKVLNSVEIVSEIKDWCWSYLSDTDTDRRGSPQLLEAAVTLFFTCSMKCSPYLSGTRQKRDAQTLASKVLSVLGSSEREMEREVSDWRLLSSEGSTYALLVSIVRYAEQELSMLNLILGRLKANRQYSEMGRTRSIEIRDRCFDKLHSLCIILSDIVEAEVEAGPWISPLVKVVTNFFSILASFAEHLIDVNKIIIRSEGPINIPNFKNLSLTVGKKFRPKVDCMIAHIEKVQRGKAMEMKAKKKNTSAVPKLIRNQFAKDSKLIPNLVFHMERFDRFLIALSKLAKVQLLGGIKLGTARDFRIDRPHRQNENEPEEEATTSNANTTANKSRKSSKPGPSSRKRKRKADD